MNISSDLLSATLSPPPAAAPQPEGEAVSAVSFVPAAAKTDNSSMQEQRSAVMSGAKDLQQSGADLETVSSFVDEQLESSGQSRSQGEERTGHVVDLYA